MINRRLATDSAKEASIEGMKRSTSYVVRTLLVVAALSVQARAQNPPQAPQQAEDVLRINTELVQTDLMVVDKQGHFVDGLQREQFELTIDGKAQPISFFEQVKAGSSKEQDRFRRC